MSFTRHGHQILGTTAEVRPPGLGVARCGGPRFCSQCALDAATALEAARADSQEQEPA